MKSTPQSGNKRRESLQVFDRLNVSPCHKDRLQCKQTIANGFQDIVKKHKTLESKAIILQSVEKKGEALTQQELLQNLLEILNKLDQTSPPPIDLDDYKDYLIFRLCRKLKEYMRTGESEEKKEEGTGRNQNNITRDVMSIHSRIEKSLSNIEKEIGHIKEGECASSIQEVAETVEEKRSKVIEKLKKQQQEKEKEEEMAGNQELQGNKSGNDPEQQEGLVESCKGGDELNRNNQFEIETKPSEILQSEDSNLGKIKRNTSEDLNERGTQTENLIERHENNVKYPTEILMSSLEKVKKHQLFYEKFEQENEALLKAESSGFNFTRRDKSLLSPEENRNRTIKSPLLAQNNEDFFEEISIFMKTNKKEDILGKIRNFGYLEKIEARYIEIVELFNEKCSGINVNSHFVWFLIKLNGCLFVGIDVSSGKYS